MMLFDILFYAFLLTAIIQLAFYLFVFKGFTFSKAEKSFSNKIPISVIVYSKNKEANLKKLVPLIAKQNYPDFEIILVNNASIDNSLDTMEELAKKYNNIKIVNVKNNEAFWANKKYALTLGIKAAKNKHLLFTDADCKPISELWIQEMSNQFSNNKTIVLGYGAYKKVKKSILNKLIRLDSMLTAIQYFSFAQIGLPFMGVSKNLAYKKEEFFKVNGFINHMNLNFGDDDLFINQVANSKNTAICTSPYSFTKTHSKETFKDWAELKKQHVFTASKYKSVHKFILGLFFISQLLFWILGITLLILNFNLISVLPVFLLIFLIKYIFIGISAKKLEEKGLMILYPFLEIFLILFQLSIFISNLLSKPSHWK